MRGRCGLTADPKESMTASFPRFRLPPQLIPSVATGKMDVSEWAAEEESGEAVQ